MKATVKPKNSGFVRQRGVALFFALIALLAISLAAVALIRSVDTSTLIAGNLAFKQAATSSGDSGVEAAMNWLSATESANASINPAISQAHPFNNNGGTAGYLNPGYYSSFTLDPLAAQWSGTASWGNANSTLVGTDSSGNTTRYIIQRMCSAADQVLGAANCLFSGLAISADSQAIKTYQDVCKGPGCASSVSPPMIRITSRTDGPRNTVSYVQVFVY
jgi:Tfp pilus assembly protein PilX